MALAERTLDTYRFINVFIRVVQLQHSQCAPLEGITVSAVCQELTGTERPEPREGTQLSQRVNKKATQSCQTMA